MPRQRKRPVSRRPPARRTPPARRPPPRVPPGTPFLTPGASPFRRNVERRSAAILIFLRGLPRWLPGFATVLLLAGGLLLPGIAGAVFIALVALLLGWLVFLSWPALPLMGKGVRSVAIVLLVGAAVGRALHRF